MSIKLPIYMDYHDNVWGRPEHDDQALFAKLILDGAQAGLSWYTILIRSESYAKAYHGWDAERIARYGAKDILLSGHLEGEDVIASQAAAVEARIGPGRVLLFGFPPQHRGQSYATFRLLFNAVLTSSGPDRSSR